MSNAWRAIGLCALTASIGCFIVTSAFESRIDAATRRTQNYRDRATINRRIAQAAPAVRVAEVRVRRLLNAARGNPKIPSAVILRRLEALGARFHVAVVFLQPQPAAEGPAKGLTLEEHLVIRLRGRFADLIRFVAEMPAGGVLLGVSELDIVAKSLQEQSPELEARVEADRFRGLNPRALGNACCAW